MLTKYWQWTSAESTVDSGVPFGPLRFRAWTSVAPASDAVSSIPFGPLRFRSWTSATLAVGGGGGVRFRVADERLRVPSPLRDDDLVLFVAAAFVTIQ